MLLPPCTSSNPLSNASRFCIPAAQLEPGKSPPRVAILVAWLEDVEGGTLAGRLLTPVQNCPHPEIEETGGNFAPTFCDCACSTSAMRPPHPLAPSPVGMAVCHWPVWSECENNCCGIICCGAVW